MMRTHWQQQNNNNNIHNNSEAEITISNGKIANGTSDAIPVGNRLRRHSTIPFGTPIFAFLCLSLFTTLISFVPWNFAGMGVNGAPLPAPPIFEAIAHYPSICYLPPESGICPSTTVNRTLASTNPGGQQQQQEVENLLSDDYGILPSPAMSADAIGTEQPQQLLTRYYFDAVTAQCYPFGAQECGGNENRFETKAECMAKCSIVDKEFVS